MKQTECRIVPKIVPPARSKQVDTGVFPISKFGFCGLSLNEGIATLSKQNGLINRIILA